MTSIRTVAALIFAVTILQLANGLLGVFMPLAMAADGLGEAGVGVVGAIYSAGFMAGAWIGPSLLARVGHIRVAAACGALLAAATLGLYWSEGVLSWALLRAVQGWAIALVFAAIESWMSSALKPQERGGVIGFYMVCTKASLALGPFLVMGSPSDAPEPVIVAGLIIALAMIPVCFTSTAQPEPPKSEPLAIAAQYRTAPAAVTAAFWAGFTNAGILTLAPLYAKTFYGEASAAGFQAAAWLGSLILQWPAGRLSDVVDRRLVIAGLGAIAGAAALTLALAGGEAPFWLAALCFAFWGAGGLSYYGIAVAHMADRAESGQIARATSGLLFVWAAGSILGPLTLGALIEVSGQRALFWFAAFGGAGLAALMLWRRGVRAEAVRSLKERFAAASTNSVATAEIAFPERPRDVAD